MKRSDNQLSVIRRSVLRTGKQTDELKTGNHTSENRKLRTDNRVTYIILLAYVFILLRVTPISFAQTPSSGTLSVSPAYLEVVLDKPNEEKSIKFTYTNNSSEPISLELYPIDFKQQGEQGGISFLGKDSGTYSYSLSSFVALETTNIELEPREKRVFTITLKNRQDISPGGHYAAIVARQVQGGQQTTVSPAVSALLFMRKTGGERFNLSIQKIDWPRFPLQIAIPSTTNITFQNAGNIHVIPYGTIEVKDMFGRLLYKGIVNTSSAIVMPESRRVIPATLRKLTFMSPISLNSYQIKGNDSLHKVTYTYQESFVYVNPLVPLVVILIAIVMWRLRKRK
jgi:hypothetical protein